MDRPYTLQEVFDRAWQAFVVEKKPKSGDESSCLYRWPEREGRCILGLCIPDELYSNQMEGRDAIGLADNFPSFYSNVFGDINKKVLLKLQACHDGAGVRAGSDFHEDIHEELVRFANNNSLQIPA